MNGTWVGLGGSVAVFTLSVYLIARLQRKAALSAARAAAEPYDIAELPAPAHRARNVVIRKWMNHGVWGYAITTVRVGSVVCGLTALTAAALVFFDRSWSQNLGGQAVLSRTPYTLGLSCLIALVSVLYVTSHDDEERSHRRRRGLLRWTATVMRAPDCQQQFDLLAGCALDASHETEQLEYDRVAASALRALPYVRALTAEDFRQTIDSHLVFVTQPGSDSVLGDTNTYANLCKHFDVLFRRLVQDNDHEDLWRVGILRSLVWYAGAPALTDLMVGEPVAASPPVIRTTLPPPDDDYPAPDDADPEDEDSDEELSGDGILQTAFGTSAAVTGSMETASGVAMVLDLTRGPDPEEP